MIRLALLPLKILSIQCQRVSLRDLRYVLGFLHQQYRTLKLTHDEATEKISELHDLLISTNASTTMSVVNSYFQYDKADISTAISTLETFLSRQFSADETE